MESHIHRVEQMECHNRKYNLLIYGLALKDHESIYTSLRNFFQTLNISSDRANNILMANAHILPRRAFGNVPSKGPIPIIVRFVYFRGRALVLTSARNLRSEKITVRTDLPPRLKQILAALAKRASELRRDGVAFRTCIRESIQLVEVWIEIQKSKGDPWTRFRD